MNYLIGELIESNIEDCENYHLAFNVLERIKSGDEKKYSADEIRKV